jgi:tetrathionate reductase subunit B
MGVLTTKKISRRDTLRLAGMGVAVLVVSEATAGTAAAVEVNGERYGMVIDLRRCTGCHACSVACKAEFNVPLGRWRSWVKVVEKGTYPKVKRHFLPRLCNHCSDPPCVRVCPTQASHIRDDGIVDIHEDICIGCRNCIAMCPYDSRFIHPGLRVAQKCDYCIHRIESGVEPSCVNTCPARARIFGDLNDPHSDISEILSTTPVQSLKPELGTEPNVFYIAADNTTMRTMGKGGEHHE